MPHITHRSLAVTGCAQFGILVDRKAAWRFIDPIREAWSHQSDGPRPYAAGTWGPAASIALIERDGRTWNEEYE